MFIKVIDWCSHTILRKDNEPVFYLERDNWEDNYYKTRYHLHLSPKSTDDGEPVWIGEVKILRKGQRKEDHALVETGKLDSLDYRFCSIGQSLDYYERIAQLHRDSRYAILSALRDIVIFPEILTEFEHEEGLHASLFHFIDRDDDIFSLAPHIISGDLDKLPVPNLIFKFQIPGMTEAATFEFDSPDYGYHEPEDVPTRVFAITGDLDSGKNEFMTKLSKLAFVSAEDRDLLQETGILEPGGVGFSKVICLSYTPFDIFQVPGIYLHEKEQIARDINKGIGRFAYCGNHNLVEELEESLKSFTIDTDGRVWEVDNQEEEKSVFLKSVSDLCFEFISAFTAIEANRTKQEYLEQALEFFLEDPDLKFIADLKFADFTDRELEEFFMNLTKGQQIAFHAITNFIHRVVPRSLVLLNEPEHELPAPLLGLFMKSIRYILDRENAHMILATQSPEILLTESKHVYVFKRAGENITLSSPGSDAPSETIDTIQEEFPEQTTDVNPLSS